MRVLHAAPSFRRLLLFPRQTSRRECNIVKKERGSSSPVLGRINKGRTLHNVQRPPCQGTWCVSDESDAQFLADVLRNGVLVDHDVHGLISHICF